jgi:muramoyltetrapeptide carboxypeptidase
MIVPPYLTKGSTIGVVGTARTADAQQVAASAKILEAQGFNVVIAPNVSQAHYRFAGDDTDRLLAFQSMLDDDTIDALWLARGGYGTVRIINAIDWSLFLKRPKWIVGFSDFTLIHLKLQRLGMASLHACTFVQIQKFGVAHENVITPIEILLNQQSNYNFASSKYNKEGKANGTLVGGNLSLICNSIGTPTQIDTAGKLLLLEDCDEYLYHYDRMFRQLKRAGLLKDIKGLILGVSTIKPEPDDIDFGYTLEEVVLEVCRDYDFPICFNAPFGHTEKNWGIVLNKEYEVVVEKDGVGMMRD